MSTSEYRALRTVLFGLVSAKRAGDIEDPEARAEALGTSVDACINWIRECLAEAPTAASPITPHAIRTEEL